MLLEEGFQVTSIDASDKMLKYALKKRWDRRKEDAFDKWGMNQFYFKIGILHHFYVLIGVPVVFIAVVLR